MSHESLAFLVPLGMLASAAVTFCLFYAKEEGKSKTHGILLALATVVGIVDLV
jgi:hypothetical protein